MLDYFKRLSLAIPYLSMSAAVYTTLPGLRATRDGGFEVELFADHHPQQTNGFSRIFHEASYGKIDFQFFVGECFQIWRSRYAMREKINLQARGDIAMLELHIPLSGEAMNWWDGRQENTLRNNQFELEFIPFVESNTLFYGEKVVETLDIHYDRKFLELFAEKFPVLQDFLQQVGDSQRTQLMKNAVRFISPQMMHIVNNILHYRGEPEFGAFYFEQQVSELLEMVLERAARINDQYSKKKYLDAAMSIRSLIEKNPSTIYTGKVLSDYTGINVSLLHKIFREYNGTSMFDYGLEARLDYAKSLLRDTSLYIFEISMECGYLEPSNLTHAFCNRFGISPQQYRDSVKK